MLPMAISDPGFFINLLEKGGLPALTLGVLMTVFMFLWRSDKKAQSRREEAKDLAFASLQKERVAARKRDSDQYKELMKAYEEMVGQFIILSKDSTRAITRLGERVGQCPLREVQAHTIVGDD